MNTITTTLRQATEELESNTRLRLGLWLILIIGVVYLLLVQSDRNAAAHADYSAAAERLSKARQLSAQGGWQSQLESAEARQQVLEAAFWEAETEGLAQASLQSALTAMVQGIDIRNARLRSGASEPVADLPGVWQIQTQLEAKYRKGAELQLLYALAQHPKKLVVDRLDLNRQNSRLMLLVSGYFVGIAQDSQ